MTNNTYAKHLTVTGVTSETRPRGSLTLIRYPGRKPSGIASSGEVLRNKGCSGVEKAILATTTP
jgi:hypothetical protein